MTSSIDTACPHCDPSVTDRNHIPEKIGIYVVTPVMSVLSPLHRTVSRFPTLKRMTEKAFFVPAFRFALLLKLLKETEIEDTDSTIYNRTLVVVREAKKRGIRIRVVRLFGHATHHFSIENKKGKRYFESLPLFSPQTVSPLDVDDKAKLKELLLAAHMPCPKGRVFKDYDSALAYVHADVGFPVVVKPRCGSLSKHVSADVRDSRALFDAIQIVRMISREFIVEEHIPGKVHRVTVVEGQVVASCWREPSNVVGDGTHTIRELITEKNQDIRRGAKQERNYTLHRIETGVKTITMLTSQQMSLDTVPEEGKKIYLHDKVVLASGADIHDNTEDIHPENIRLFNDISRLCGVPLIGIDCIADDLSVPYSQQQFGVIEVNSHPYIDMHHVPSTGKERNVAGAILDLYLAQQ